MENLVLSEDAIKTRVSSSIPGDKVKVCVASDRLKPVQELFKIAPRRFYLCDDVILPEKAHCYLTNHGQ